MSFKFNFTEDHLKQMLPNNKEVSDWYAAMTKILPKYGIDTPERVAGFIAQCGHESASFTVLEENLYYRAETLEKLFSKYFSKAGRNAEDYAKKPDKIANVIYANRMGNVSPASGEGYKFRGRGVIQLTGKSNYMNFAASINSAHDLDKVVEYVQTKRGALESACWYWNSRNLNAVCDANDIVKMTKLINGGTIGLDDRKKHYEHAIAVLTGKAVHVETKAAAAPTASSTRDSAGSLKVGSRGPKVKKLQTALGISADGVFGPGTATALKEWQEANGLVADGIAGPETQSKLF